MTRKLNQAGFGHVAIVFVLLFVAVAGFAGYKVVSMNQGQKSGVSTVAPQATPAVSAPESINSNADLQQTAKALESSSASVNDNLNDASLNADVNALL